MIFYKYFGNNIDDGNLGILKDFFTKLPFNGIL